MIPQAQRANTGLNPAMGKLTSQPPSAPGAPATAGQQVRHFQIDHLQTDLKRRAVSSGVVTLSSQAAKFGLNLVSIAILARLLNPQDFGLLAMANSLTS